MPLSPRFESLFVCFVVSHRSFHKLLPADRTFDTDSSKIIGLPMIKTEYGRKIFSFTGAKEYNMLPLEAREMPTTDFLTLLKKQFS